MMSNTEHKTSARPSKVALGVGHVAPIGNAGRKAARLSAVCNPHQQEWGLTCSMRPALALVLGPRRSCLPHTAAAAAAPRPPLPHLDRLGLGLALLLLLWWWWWPLCGLLLQSGLLPLLVVLLPCPGPHSLLLLLLLLLPGQCIRPAQYPLQHEPLPAECRGFGWVAAAA